MMKPENFVFARLFLPGLNPRVAQALLHVPWLVHAPTSTGKSACATTIRFGGVAKNPHGIIPYFQIPVVEFLTCAESRRSRALTAPLPTWGVDYGVGDGFLAEHVRYYDAEMPSGVIQM